MGLKRKTQTRIANIARRIGGPLVSMIGRTLRLEVRGWTVLQHLLKSGKPVILQLWHGDMFIAWYVTAPLHPAAIVSQAGDGDIASAVLEGLNFETFRGSSTRGGRRAYMGMISYLKKQNIKVAAFASDGPRGPRRILKPGTYVAAQHLDGYIIPTATKARWSLSAKGWDKFAIPLPFSKAVVNFGDAIKVDRTLRGEAFERALEQASETCKAHQEHIDLTFKD